MRDAPHKMQPGDGSGPEFTIYRFEINYWGQQVPVVDPDEWTVIRPIAKELGWPIVKAIKFAGGVKRVIFEGVNMTRKYNGSPSVFAIPKTQEPAFRAAAQEYAERLAARIEANAMARGEQERRQREYDAKRAIYKTYDDAMLEAYAEDRKASKAADAAYKAATNAAATVFHAATDRARQAYREAEREAGEDRDEALAELRD